MKRLFLIIMTLMMLISIVASATAQKWLETRNGYFWTRLESEVDPTSAHLIKLAFVLGYSEASQSISIFLDSLGSILPEGDRQRRLLSGINSWLVVRYCPENITYGQLIEGLDEYYGDWKNKSVLFPEAFADITMQVFGQSLEEIKSTKKYWRGKSFQERWGPLLAMVALSEPIDTAEANRVHCEFSDLARSLSVTPQYLLNYLKTQAPGLEDTTEQTEIYRQLQILARAYSMTVKELLNHLKAQRQEEK